ncbi:hypothetical protein C8J57DRAFT_1243990 [Mycena rebaudengoi]|nr:hypothetical protein C8J57DRAFT_1243990 [Mycena rebaudengoi]
MYWPPLCTSDLVAVGEDDNCEQHQTRAFNTETAEQLNSWLGGFESQLWQISDHSLFSSYGAVVVDITGLRDLAKAVVHNGFQWVLLVIYSGMSTARVQWLPAITMTFPGSAVVLPGVDSSRFELANSLQLGVAELTRVTTRVGIELHHV